MNETTKQSPVTAIKNFAVKNQTKILAVVAVTSVTVNVLQGRGLANHNAFLKEHGLFDQFYATLTDDLA